MKGKIFVLFFILSTLFSSIAIQNIVQPINAASTQMLIVNPVDGSNNFTYSTATTFIGTNIDINLTVKDVSNLLGWEARVNWDPTLLSFVSLVFPSDDVFHDRNLMRLPTDSSVPGTMLCGAVADINIGAFTGNGTLAVLTLRIIKAPTLLNPTLTCPIQYENVGVDTVLADPNGVQIPETPTNGVYKYVLAEPPKPGLQLVPTVIWPANLGDTFAVNVRVSDLQAGWEVIAFNFSIAWNATLMAPITPYFAQGTFLETFAYYPGDVWYSISLNQHSRLPPETELPLDYNYSHVSEIMLPDPPINGSYHPPFPSGNGALGTFYFNATFGTIFPEMIYSEVDLIAEDVVIINHFNQSVGYSSLNNALYRAPARIATGFTIDLYGGANNSGYGAGYPGPFPVPFGGQGPDQPMDVVFPESEVTLYATVANDTSPVQNATVDFVLNGPSSSVNLTATTDAEGIAKIVYKMPWSTSHPEDYSGLWNANASVSIEEYTFSDATQFFYEYPVHFATVHTDKYSYNNLDTVQVMVIFSTHVLQWYSGTFTSTLENSSGTPISSSSVVLMFGGAVFGVWKNSMFMTSFIIPFGVSGYAYVHQNCYDKDPSSGGVKIAAEYEPPPEISIGPLPDVAVTNVTFLKTVVGQGYVMNFTTVVENQGDSAENFNVTIYANGSAAGFLTFSLASGSNETRAFFWNTSGSVYGNYTLLLAADVIPGETDTADNNFTCPISIHVGVPGDITSPTPGVYDGTSNMRDIQYLILLFNTNPGSPNWKPNADVNNDGTVNMRDIQIAILNFNKHE